jgi:glucosamine 6-phosphate synthetase-like amidotransferase/phosphosugar isomerase protein
MPCVVADLYLPFTGAPSLVGYDSAGLAVVDNEGHMTRVRRLGKVQMLAQAVEEQQGAQRLMVLDDPVMDHRNMFRNMRMRIALRRLGLEYRGYDSAGLAVVDNEGHMTRVRRLGKVQMLAQGSR